MWPASQAQVWGPVSPVGMAGTCQGLFFSIGTRFQQAQPVHLGQARLYFPGSFQISA